MKEYILCAAIWFKNDREYAHQPLNIDKGFVLCGFRHCSIFGQTGLLTEERQENGITAEIQGFLTNKNRFVEREKALEIAWLANQLNVDHIAYLSKKQLYSEDLY